MLQTLDARLLTSSLRLRLGDLTCSFPTGTWQFPHPFHRLARRCLHLGIHGLSAVPPPLLRQTFLASVPMEKPQTTIYVGKIASTVENAFMESLLQLCGPVKSWRRAVDPSGATFRGFGFCEFESAEGVLRALRLLNKFNIDGQQLVLNVNQATWNYLECYIEKKTERKKLKETKARGSESENGCPLGNEKREPMGCEVEISEDAEKPGNNDSLGNAQNFGIVTDEDQDADNDALEKLTSMVEERQKTKSLPSPPPLQTSSDPAKSVSVAPSKLRDLDSDVATAKNAEDKNDKEMTSENKPTVFHDMPKGSSSGRARRCNGSRQNWKDRVWYLKWEERELERYEREYERDRVRREREHGVKTGKAECLYMDLVKKWEARERKRQNRLQKEVEKETERVLERHRKIRDQENESDDDDLRKQRHCSVPEKRRKRQREKDGDLVDRLREEDEIAEAKRGAIEENKQKEESSFSEVNGGESAMLREGRLHGDDEKHLAEQPYESDSLGKNAGKRTAVPSVFHEVDGDEEKNMRPFVQIAYSPEEPQADQRTASETLPNLVVAAEFARHISSLNPKKEKSWLEEGEKKSSDQTSQREQDCDVNMRDKNGVKSHDKPLEHDKDHEDKCKAALNSRYLEAKLLVDTVPKAQEELFSYEIHWDVYDKHKLHERVRSWISKKIEEHFGVAEAILIDYVVSRTKEHEQAPQIVELLRFLFEDETEMFVLRMWRQLIFEIKNVETRLNVWRKCSCSRCGSSSSSR